MTFTCNCGKCKLEVSRWTRDCNKYNLGLNDEKTSMTTVVNTKSTETWFSLSIQLNYTY